MAVGLLEQQMNQRGPERRGNRSAWWAPQGCYRCAGDDRWCVITCRDDAEFARMAQAMGHAEWAQDERFATVLARFEHHDALDALITEWTSQRDHYDVMRTLQDAGVVAAAVLDGKEVLFDPHFASRGQFDEIDQPMLGRRPVQKHLAAKFRRFDPKTERHAPLL